MITSDKNIREIEKLKMLIINQLVPLIKSDYVLLDIPNHGNIGDQLIYEGEIVFLDKYVKKHRCVYSSYIENTNYDKISKTTTILLHGGGNFGDIYFKHQDFRMDVIRKYPENPIIIMPQTVFYKSEVQLENDAKIFNDHSNIYICVRDKTSYILLNKYIESSKLLLLPDMAFCISDLDKSLPNKKLGGKTRVLLMDRIDVEYVVGATNLASIKNHKENGDLVFVKDWPTYYSDDTNIKLYNTFNIWRRRIFRVLMNLPVVSNYIHDHTNNVMMKDHYVKMGVKFLSDYDIIYTTRLHGLILAILLGKESIALDNSYGKLSSFYDTWLTNFENVTKCKIDISAS